MSVEIIHIGDRVRRRLVTLPTEIGADGKWIPPVLEGAVVYIHPQGRYHEVQFDFAAGSFRESFHGLADSYPGDGTMEPFRKLPDGQHMIKKPHTKKQPLKRGPYRMK